MAFTRKVLGIVAAQMTLTFAFSLLAAAIPAAGRMFKNPTILMVSLIGLIATMLALLCNPPLRKEVPTNYILLGTFTVCEAAMIASIGAQMPVWSVLAAIVGVCLSTVGLYGAALYTKDSANLQRNLI